MEGRTVNAVSIDEAVDVALGLFAATVLLCLVERRFWCKYLCPVPAFSDYLRFIKSRLKVLRSALTQTPALKNE